MANPEVEGTPVEGEAPAAEPWYAQVSQEDFEAMRETTEQVRQAFAQQQEQQQQYQQAQPPEYDPDDFLTVAQARELIQRETAPLSQSYQQQQEAAANEQMKDMLGSYASEKGYEISDRASKQILAYAQVVAPEHIAKYGQGQRAVEAAIDQAADDYMAEIADRQKAYYEQQVNQLQGLRRAPQEMPATQNASPQLTPGQSQGGTERDLVASWFGRK